MEQDGAESPPSFQDTINAGIAELAELERQLNAITDKANADIDVIKAKAVEDAKPLTERRDALWRQLYGVWVENRFVLTQGGKRKSATFPAGELREFKGKPRVDVEDESLAIRWIRKLRLAKRFLRWGKVTLNKDAIGKDPETAKKIHGLRVVQDDFFAIKPAKTDFDLKRDVRELEAPAEVDDAGSATETAADVDPDA